MANQAAQAHPEYQGSPKEGYHTRMPRTKVRPNR
jgi:hypothetical protein